MHSIVTDYIDFMQRCVLKEIYGECHMLEI